MLPEPAQLAQAGAAALATAAGTQLWDTARTTLARLFAYRSQRAEDNALDQLDKTREQLAQATPEEREKIEGRWRDRLEDLLAELDEDDRAQAAERINVLAEQAQHEGGGVTQAREGSMAAGRDLNIKAEGGSIVAGRIDGGITMGNPPPPGTDKA